MKTEEERKKERRKGRKKDGKKEVEKEREREFINRIQSDVTEFNLSWNGKGERFFPSEGDANILVFLRFSSGTAFKMQQEWQNRLEASEYR